MSEGKYIYIGKKVIVFVTISFLMLMMAMVFVVYSVLQDNTSAKIETFTTNSFNSFARRLDELFVTLERIGNRYSEDLVSSIVAGNLTNQYENITKSLLFSSPFISEVTLCLLPDINHSNLISYNCCVLDNDIIVFQELDTSSVFFQSLLRNPVISYPLQYKKVYWSDPYYSVFASSFPLIGTLSVPLINTFENEIYGIMTMSFRMSYIDDIVLKFNLSGNSFNVLLGNNGNIAVHPIEKYLMMPTNFGYNVAFSDIASDLYLDNKHIFNKNEYFKFNTIRLDSLGSFKCENSFALSYKLRNNWRFLTVFKDNLFYSYNDTSVISKLAFIVLFFCITFFIVILIGTNKLLNHYRILIAQFLHFEQFDILDWRLSVTKSGKNKNDIDILTNSFDKLHNAYINVQNKYTDQLIENEKLTFSKQQTDIMIEQAIKEETEAITSQNQYLATSLDNMSEFIQLGRIICSTLSVEKISKAIYERLARLIPIKFFGIYIFDKEKNKLVCENGILENNTIPSYSLNIPEKNTIAVKCFDTNEIISINNFELEHINYLLVSPYNPIGIQCSSKYYAPISDRDEVLGLFTIQCKEKGVFKKFNTEYLDSLQTYLKLSINNILKFRELKISLEIMKSTQNKLIQNERMASVGQLSAGIAHEIKNPLNFILNFADLSTTLVKDIVERMEEYKTQPEEEIYDDITDLISDMELNLTKIKEHSLRLDKIVKNMQIHSNDSANEFLLTNINYLVAEYTKFAYYGFRSSNPLLNVKLTYNLDENIEDIYVVSNNMSRVVINIVSNACFATNTKFQKYNDDEYKPEISITTTNLDNDYIEIIIRDNGEGIPDNIKNKIFTPFFTTKAAGEGTGLGLSMCYEIIVQGHKGEIICNSEVGEYTEFIIKLPKKNI